LAPPFDADFDVEPARFDPARFDPDELLLALFAPPFDAPLRAPPFDAPFEAPLRAPPFEAPPFFAAAPVERGRRVTESPCDAAPVVVFVSPERVPPAFFRVDFEPVAMRMLLRRRCVRDTKQELGTHRYLRKGFRNLRAIFAHVRACAHRCERYILGAARHRSSPSDTRAAAATLQPGEGHVRRVLTTMGAAAMLAACGGDAKNEGMDTAAPAISADTGAGAMAADPTVNAAGATGVPAGYTGRTDREGMNIADAKYTPHGDTWEVQTGPAHIVYAAKDNATGSYTATARFEQMEAPAHPEAYGIFVGGQNLDQPTQKYTYFIVRGGGEYTIKVREGADTREVKGWTANAAIPKADASGKAAYDLKVHVAADSVHFFVNDKMVATAPKSAVPTDGVAGLRINHNLHVTVKPVAITK
jgi:hypothetical protein